MDVSHILDDLNKAQRDAVASDALRVLVLAGAGSGKTRVLIHRIAWLMEVFRVSPHSILAVTFTNKAAGEMRARADALAGSSSRGLWIGTFHGLAHRLLRMHFAEAGLNENFQILDSDDQLRLIKRVIRDQNLDEAKWQPRRAQWYINDLKDEGMRAESVDPGDDPVARTWRDIYLGYEQACERANVVDFAELLLRAHELWLHEPELLRHYQGRFQHILVDEFQDTNTIQYAWIRVLAGNDASVFVVGDDDQSIYGWRGAKVENMQRYTKEFGDVQTVRLEQNYRSSGNILRAANAVIANNRDRLGKNLWTEDAEGEPIQLYAGYNEMDEAFFVVDRIRQWIDEGHSANDVAILYRSNAQSRLFEQQLITKRIPYRVYGGLRFFERAEVKDALSYLRLCASRGDDPAFERVVNVPTRGVGAKTLDQIRATAVAERCSLWEAANKLIATSAFTARAGKAVASFISLVDDLDEACTNADLGEMVRLALEHSELLSHYEKEGPERLEARQENLDELVTAAQTFDTNVEDEEMGLSPLAAFLSRAALEAGEEQAQAWEDCVQLMTLHSAKGLEFPLVFLVGVEEGLFPNQRSIEEDGRLEEERRLCYVGITRARRLLYVTYAESRRWRGQENRNLPSRFIFEIPEDLVRDIRPRPKLQPTLSQQPSWQREDTLVDTGYSLGQRVRHSKFGEGIITDFEGSGAHTRVHVNFEQTGTKILVLAYANLEAA